MLDIPLGLYQTGSEYPGRSPTLLVCVTPAFQFTRRYWPSGAYMIFERYFMLMNAKACWLVVEKALILINSGLRWDSQDGIAHANFTGVSLFHIVIDRFNMWDLLCWGSAENESRIWWFAPFLSGVSHYETAQSVFGVYQYFLVSSNRGLVGRFFLFQIS